MGGDGGSIPGRADMVRTSGYKFTRNLGGMGYAPNSQIRAADEHMSSSQVKDFRWKTCCLSQEPLAMPIMACRAGLLYNKEAVIKYILSKKPLQSMQHTKGLKDFKELKLQFDSRSRRFICPLMRTELGGSNRGVLIWKCGCCISEKAFKELMKEHTSGEVACCPNCNKEFTYNPLAFDFQAPNVDPLAHDIVVLVPDFTEEGYLRAKLMKRGISAK